MRLTADRPAIAANGKDLCFVQIQCVDAAGNPVLGDQREIKVELLGGGTLAALGTADPKPDRLLPFAGPVCPLYDGAAMAIIRSEGGAKGALLRVTLGELVAELGIGFTPVAAQSLPVHEAAPMPPTCRWAPCWKTRKPAPCWQRCWDRCWKARCWPR